MTHHIETPYSLVKQKWRSEFRKVQNYFKLERKTIVYHFDSYMYQIHDSSLRY